MGYDGIVRVVKAEHLSEGHSEQKYQLGALHFKDGNEYRYVYNGGNSVIGTGKYCVLQQSSSSFTSAYTVTVTNASLAGWMVGVAQNSISTGYYGFVMREGVSLISTDSGEVSANVGVDLALGTDGGFVAAGATFSTAPRFGFTLNSFITGATSKARVFGGV
jgi:predicted RecA/RadA family phage recombinase